MVLACSGKGWYLKEIVQPQKRGGIAGFFEALAGFGHAKTPMLPPHSYELVPINPAAGAGSGPYARAPDGSHLCLSQITFLPYDSVWLLGGQYGVPMKLTYKDFMEALKSFSTSTPEEKKRG